jgi:hypothetical protein
LNGCDAVVSSLGTGLSPFREVSLLTVATGALVTAMTRNGVRRLVWGAGTARRGHGGFVFDRLSGQRTIAPSEGVATRLTISH